ncbi:O-antigen ligase family protein, partial [Salmonella enterica subsp. enterica serovar Minnesota]|nr:O-antigen ligase family protein [Salmonella enterica subsp. enterica serovar Minnesota]
LFFVGYIWGTQPFLQGEYATLIFTSSIIMLIFLPQMIRKSTFNINIAFIVIIIFYSLESYIRIKNPDYDFEPKEISNSILDTFYIYKVNSIAFEDSNFVAMILTCYYILCRVLGKEKVYGKTNVIYSLLFLALIVLTFSRSAYIGVIVFESLMFYQYSKRYRVLSIFSIVIAVIVFLYFLLDKIQSDGSFQSKFYIFDLFLNYIKVAPLFDVLTGVGFGNTFSYIGIGPHNIYIALFIETGLIGLILYLLIFIYIYIKYKFSRLIILPIMIMGLSFSPIALPYFYVALSWLMYLERKNGYFER